MSEKILIVSKDINLLHSFQEMLGQKYNLQTTSNPGHSLTTVKSEPFAIIIADNKFDNTDSIRFFSQVKRVDPDAVRIGLTDADNPDYIIKLVNEANVFKVLTKPVNLSELLNIIKDSIEYHHQILKQKAIASETIKGTIQILVDIIATTTPQASGRLTSLRQTVKKVANRLGLVNISELNIIAVLSHMGWISIPPKITKKKLTGQQLSSEENEIYRTHSEVGNQLLAKLPRLEEVARAIKYQQKHYDGGGFPSFPIKGKDIPIGARILKVATDFDELCTQMEPLNALGVMKNRKNIYDPDILLALEAEVYNLAEGYTFQEVEVSNVTSGMVLAKDIFDNKGVVLLSKGQEISDPLRLRLKNYAQLGYINKPIEIISKIC